MNISYLKHKSVMLASALAFIVMCGIAMTASAQNQAFAPSILSSAGCTVTVSSGQSINAAVSGVGSGAVVCVRAGVYNEQIKLTPTKSGITVQAYPGETPVLDGTGVTVGAGSNSHFAGLVHITGSNITVEGFEVRDSNGRGVVVAQSTLSQPTSNVTVRNMIVHDNYESGINVNGTEQVYPNNILIEGNEVYDNLKKNQGDLHLGGSALVFTETENSIARGNTIYHNMGEGLVAGRFSANITLEGNVSYDNVHANLYIVNTERPLIKGNFIFCTNDRTYWKADVFNGQTVYKAGKGIQIRDENFENRENRPPPSFGKTIINNVVVGCGANFGVATQIEGGGLVDSVVANNTFANAQGDIAQGTNNVLFEKNIVLSNTLFANNLLIQTLHGANVRVQNSTPPIDLSQMTTRNNLYWPAPPSSWFPSEPGRVVQNPQLVNPLSPTMNNLADPSWYGLLANSPAINAGGAVTQVTDDFQGAARSAPLDIGAFEHTSGASTGQIRVAVTVGSGSGTPQLSFVSSFAPGSFQLAAGSTFESGALQPGMHDVALTPLAGWTQTSATCDDASDPLAIDLGSGETVTCTFTIAEQAQTGTIIIAKETVPGGTTQPFSFTASYNAGFQLTHGQTHTANALSAGTYSVQESIPSGWSATSATCSDGSTPASINLAAGETVTCTFISTQDPATGTIIVAKETNPDGSTDPFTFTTSYDAGFSLKDGETSVSTPLTAGTYWVEVGALAGWTPTGASCSDGSAPSAINLAAGETVTCTFTSLEDVPTESGEMLYLSAKIGGTVADFSYAMEDVVGYDMTNDEWSLYLDMSLVGVSKNLDAFVIMDDGSILMTFARTQGLTDLGLVTARDVVRFIPTGTGSATAGTFEWYFQGVDVGLTTSGEAIDALALTPDGRLLISTVSAVTVQKAGGSNLKGRDEDLLVFTSSSLGENATGTWDMYLDGSNVPGLGVEDINGAWVDPANGDIYLNLYTAFNVGGKTGNSRNIIRLRPTSDGYSTEIYWFGPDHGFAGVSNAFTIVR